MLFYHCFYPINNNNSPNYISATFPATPSDHESKPIAIFFHGNQAPLCVSEHGNLCVNPGTAFLPPSFLDNTPAPFHSCLRKMDRATLFDLGFRHYDSFLSKFVSSALRTDVRQGHDEEVQLSVYTKIRLP